MTLESKKKSFQVNALALFTRLYINLWIMVTLTTACGSFSITCALILTKLARMTDSDVTLFPYPHSSVVTQFWGVGLVSGLDHTLFRSNKLLQYCLLNYWTASSYRHCSFSLMIGKWEVVFPSESFGALQLRGVFSNTDNYSVRAALYNGLKGQSTLFWEHFRMHFPRLSRSNI